MEAVGPLELHRVMVGHVAAGLPLGEEVAPPLAEGTDGRAARDPVEDVPDVDRLLDHPVARSGATGEPVVVAVHRAVAADPGGAALDQAARARPGGSGRPRRDSAGSTAAGTRRERPARGLGRLGDQRVALGDGQRQRLLGVEVLARPDRRAIDRGVQVAGQGDERPRRRRSAPGAARGRSQRVGPGAPWPSRRSPGPRTRCLASASQTATTSRRGARAGAEQAVPRVPEADQPQADRAAVAGRLADPALDRARPAAAEQPRNRRRFRRIGGMGQLPWRPGQNADPGVDQASF